MTPKPSRLASIAAGFLRLLPRGRWVLASRLFPALRALGMPPVVECPVGPYRLRLRTDDFYQLRMAIGYYEQDLDRLLSRVLRRGDTYVDVGAQVGFTAALAARHIGPTGSMILFEPDPRAFARLEENLGTARGPAPRVSARPEACSEAAGMAELRTSPSLGWSRVQTGGTTGGGGREVVAVRLVRLDYALEAAAAGHIRVLKMDVEGHELFALRGLQETLSAGRVDYVYMEKHLGLLRQHGAVPVHLHALLAKHGYRAVLDDGTRAGRAGMEREQLENLLYARDEELLRLAAPNAGPPIPEQEYSQGEIAQAWAEAMDPVSPALRAHRLMYQAASGDIRGAIAEGETLLAANPSMGWFRGHLAHWHVSIGQYDKALNHYGALLASSPDDAELMRLIDETREALRRAEGA